MKKRLIALRGSSSVGKSTSLHMLYRLLITEPSNKPLSFTSIGRKFDFEAVVLVGGYKVGLVNRGDIPKVLQSYLSKFVAMRCDVIVCTARTKGAFNPLLTSFRPRYELIEVPKKPNLNASQAISNLHSAHDLASRIYEAIDKKSMGSDSIDI
ncbi:MAG: hypothetical protein PHT15_04870 [Gallionellaceae bacterium]|nr:hypothetical protein [Gallionellaceae bacterium]